ncbi:Hypothetical predicted protein [Pelobates cultripes]|uniref:Uncharacterized protein n=1 Tax=Pelobates cultripes TaxID=61616 RepID=A0AAD1W1X2_PELCU|nr:Hypothetical predicted protein [Pelobates cultripes]
MKTAVVFLLVALSCCFGKISGSALIIKREKRTIHLAIFRKHMGLVWDRCLLWIPEPVPKPVPKVPEPEPKPVPKVEPAPKPVPKIPEPVPKPVPKVPEPVPKPVPKVPEPVPNQPKPAPPPVPLIDCLIQLLKKDAPALLQNLGNLLCDYRVAQKEQNIALFMNFLNQVENILVVTAQNAEYLSEQVAIVLFQFVEDIIQRVMKILEDIPIVRDFVVS